MLDGPFTTQEAILAGITPRQLRGRAWRAPFRGVHERRDAPTDLAAQCRALARVLPPEAVFSGVTVARLRGWWLPRHAELLPLHVTVPLGHAVGRPGGRATRSPLGAADVVEHEGLRVTAGLRTLTDLAADWSLIDLVVMADAALRFGDCAEQEWELAAALRGGRGVRTLRRAIRFTDPRSESAMETVLRLIIVVPGLPAPTPQAILRDAEGGWLARVDSLEATAQGGLRSLPLHGARHLLRCCQDSLRLSRCARPARRSAGRAGLVAGVEAVVVRAVPPLANAPFTE